MSFEVFHKLEVKALSLIWCEKMKNISPLRMNRFLRQSAFTEGMNLQADCPKTARGWFIFRETDPPLL